MPLESDKAHVQITLLEGCNRTEVPCGEAFVEAPRNSYARDGILLSDRSDLK